MIGFVKFAFRAAAVLCLLQFAVGRLDLDRLLSENIRFDLNRNCANLERNFDKEFTNARQKLFKEYFKLTEKLTTKEAKTCLDAAHKDAERDLNVQSQELQRNLKELRNSLEVDLKPDAGLREIFDFRNGFRNRMNDCKNSIRFEIKSIVNKFSLAGKRCLY